MNVHRNTVTKSSLNNFKKLAKAYKMGVCELVFCLVVLKWCTADGIMFYA